MTLLDQISFNSLARFSSISFESSQGTYLDLTGCVSVKSSLLALTGVAIWRRFLFLEGDTISPNFDQYLFKLILFVGRTIWRKITKYINTNSKINTIYIKYKNTYLSIDQPGPRWAHFDHSIIFAHFGHKRQIWRDIYTEMIGTDVVPAVKRVPKWFLESLHAVYIRFSPSRGQRGGACALCARVVLASCACAARSRYQHTKAPGAFTVRGV